MSDEGKTASEAVKDAEKRPPVAIDLGKADIREIAVEPAADTSATPEQPADKPRIDPAQAYVEARLARPENAPPAAAAPAVKSGRAGAIFGGALAGGVVGLLSAIGYATLNAPPAQTPDPRIATLEAAVSAIDKRLSGANPDIDRLASALKAAEGRIAALDARPPSVPKAVEDRLASLDGALAGARQQAAEALRKIDGIETLTAVPPAPAGTPPQDAPRIDLAPIAARVVKVEEALNAADARVAAGSDAIAALDARLKAAEQSVSALSRPRASESASAILGAASLARRALDAGEPLGAPVSALTALGVPQDSVKPLAVYADKPAPRLATLAADFADGLARLPRSAAPEPAKEARDLSVSDRLKANLTSLVEVRPAGAPRAPDAAGLAAQAGKSLLAGDFDAFARAVAGLPAEQRAALKPTLDAIASRAAAVQAIGRIEAAALDAAARRN